MMYKRLNKIFSTTSRSKLPVCFGLFLFIFLSLTNNSINAHGHDATCEQTPKSCIEENTLHLGLSVGIGLRTNPLFDSDNIPLILLPQLNYYSGNFFIDNLDLGYNLYQSRQTSINFIATPSFDSVFFNRWDPGNVFVNLSSGSGFAAAAPPNSDLESDRETLISPEELSKREFSYFGGIEFSTEIETGLLQFSALGDITGTHSGSEIRFAYSHIFTDNLSTTFGLTWKDKKLTDYYYGVDANEIVDDRGAYQANASLSPFVRASYENELSDGDSWRFSFEYQKLDSEINDSPIAVDDYVITFFAGKTFRF